MCWSEIKKHWDECEEKDAQMHKRWTTDALKKAAKAVQSLQEEGWRDICYATTGRYYLVWEPGHTRPSIAVARCDENECWTKRQWAAEYCGGLWPIRPSHYKELPDDAPQFYIESNKRFDRQAEEERRKKEIVQNRENT